MKHLLRFLDSVPEYLLASVAGALTLAQAVLAFLFHRPGQEAAQWAGWICLWTAGVFGVLPIITLRKKGDVPKGKGYVHTKTLVNSGIYGIVRHPQGGVAGLLINAGVILIARHWSTTALGAMSLALTYLDTFSQDRMCIGKFGEDYRRYMKRVPRVNFVAGLFRLLERAGRKEDL
jgi:protein-S-isoprenylcysteine O-methyltransferase Ste14